MAKYPGDPVYQIWSSNIDLNTIGIENYESSVPAGFEIMQNYPNPFNPSTTIKYKVNRSGVVSLKVYDIMGKEITTLVNGVKNTGEHSVTFDGSNLSSGIYFCGMKSESSVRTVKMILIK